MEQLCAPYFEADNKPGGPSIAPGVYFRMLFVGYFEGIESRALCHAAASARETGGGERADAEVIAVRPGRCMLGAR